MGKWHKFPLSLPKTGLDSPGPEGSGRAVPHLLVRGWRSRSGHAGGDFAELEQRNGAGGDPKHRGTQTRSCHRPRGGKRESLPDSANTYLEKLQRRRIFLSKTQARFLLSSPFVFKLLNLFLALRGQRGGTAAKQDKGPACWPWRAGPGMLLSLPSPPLRSCTCVVFPVVKPSGTRCPPARRRAGPRGQGGHWDNGSRKDSENFKPLEY